MSAQVTGIDDVDFAVLEVLPESAAAKAGFRPVRRSAASGRIVLGDVIIGLEGARIGNQDDLFHALENRRPGEAVTVTLVRDGSERDVSIVLQPIAPR